MITAFYGALLGLFLFFLSVQVIRKRRAQKISIGEGEDPALIKSIRAHGNFTEYTPLVLLLIFMLESNITTGWWVHVLCLLLLVGRVLHAYGMSQLNEDFRFRVSGMMLTFFSLLLSSLSLLGVVLLAA